MSSFDAMEGVARANGADEQENERRIEPSDWDAAVNEMGGPQIVVGGPGSGKTEFLVRRTAALLGESDVKTDSILILSFGRRGVADLRHRISAVIGSVGDLDVATFHSYAMRTLESFGEPLGWSSQLQVLTGPEQLALVAELLAADDPANWSAAYRGILGTRTFAQELTDFILRAAEQLLDADDVASAERADWRGIPAFLRKYHTELQRRQRIDYGTLLLESVRLIESPHRPPGSPRYVLVDEYQDTTLAQARLLKALIVEHSNLTVAADPYQSVYSFRGARLENVVEFPETFTAVDGTPGRRIVLTTSFRTPGAILDAAVNVTSRRLPGAAGKVVPAPGRGRVDVHIFGQQTEESEWVASEVERIHVTQGVALSDIGVVVRSKRRFLPELSRALERRGLPHDLPDSRLSDHPAVRFVLDLAAAVDGKERPAERARAMRRVLLGPMYRVSLAELRKIERIAGTTGWAAAVAASGHANLAQLIANDSWAVAMPAAEGAWHIWVNLDDATAIATSAGRVDERLAWRSLVQVLDRWNERNPDKSLADYRSLTESDDFEAQPLLSFRRPVADRLAVTTLHQAKGLEFDTVFICDAVEGVFPDLRARDSLLGVRHLLDHVPTEPAEYTAFRLQEERRLAYTAMTRARSRVVWTATSVGAEAGRGVPSRFLPLVAGVASVDEISAGRPERGVPVSPREAEADLRRTVADPKQPGPRRLAAIAALAAGEQWGLRPPAQHHGVVPRGPDTGLNGPVLRLSPSEADGYARCPRRYALERKLGLAGDSIYARFGSLVHEVLDRVEADAMAQGQLHSSFPAASRCLDELLDPAEYGGEPYATAWRNRALDGLARLYNQWPSGARPVGVERKVQFDLGDVTWRGRIDRIELDEEGVRIVDYKTTKNPPTKKDVEESLQLGFYALAVGADLELRSLGEPVSAEFWYPLHGSQSVATRALDMAKLEAIGHRLIQLGDDIAAERWQPAPGEWCDRCDFATSCPAQAEGGDQFA